MSASAKLRELLQKYVPINATREKAIDYFVENYTLEEMEEISRGLRESIKLLEKQDKEES